MSNDTPPTPPVDWNAILHHAASIVLYFLIALAMGVMPMLTDRSVTMDARSWGIALCAAVIGAAGGKLTQQLDLKGK